MLKEILIPAGTLVLGALTAFGIDKYRDYRTKRQKASKQLDKMLDLLLDSEKRKHEALTELEMKMKQNLKKDNGQLEMLLKELIEKGVIKNAVAIDCQIKDKSGYIKLKDSNELKFTADDYCYEINAVTPKRDPKTDVKILDILWNAKNGSGKATIVEILENETRLVLGQTRIVNVPEDEVYGK